MIQQNAIAPFSAGAVFSAAWWIFLDLVVTHDSTLDSSYYAPGAVATFGVFLALLVPVHEFREDSMIFASSSNKSCARACLFVAFIVSLTAIASSFFLSNDVEHFVIAENDRWIVGTLVAQTVLIFVSGILCISHKMTREQQIL